MASYIDIISTISAKQPGVSATATSSNIFTIVGPTGPTGVGIAAIISATAPSMTGNGYIWYNTEEAALFVYDGAWIQI